MSATEGTLLSSAGPAYRVCSSAAHALAINCAGYVDRYRAVSDTAFDRAHLLDAFDELRKAGFRVRSDTDAIVMHFAVLRAEYIADLAAMARYWDCATEPDAVQPIAGDI